MSQQGCFAGTSRTDDQTAFLGWYVIGICFILSLLLRAFTIISDANSIPVVFSSSLSRAFFVKALIPQCASFIFFLKNKLRRKDDGHQPSPEIPIHPFLSSEHFCRNI